MLADEIARVPDSDIHGRYIFAAIREGLEPFKPETINLYAEFDIDYNRYSILAEVLFPDHRLRWRAFSNAFDWAEDPFKETFRIADRMLRAFRYREALPIPDNIVLGES